ncbi:MAG: glutamate synthase large subunit [Chloroflexi bacterium]|nr:glutamate synthase large subunit [Chloroflexota bacterium]
MRREREPSPGARFWPPLYNADFERASCGVGFVARLDGRPAHAVLQMGLEAVVNLTHRGAVSADAKTGDGAGILTQIPLKLFHRVLAGHGLRLLDEADLAVGMVFLPQGEEAKERCITIVSNTLARYSMPVLLWRKVPVDPSALGERALATMPDIRQVLMVRPAALPQSDFPRTLYLTRKEIENQARNEGLKGLYFPSFSHRTIVYKGMLVAPQLARFYLDLQDPEYETAMALFHQRYSTNTFPNWFLAQPFRFLGHNGEINTLQGNQNWMKAREPELLSSAFGDRVRNLAPVIVPGGSDSANLDNVLEALVMGGRDVVHVMTMLVPEAWENMPHIDPRWKAFYEYHGTVTEPWDGPAALAFSDGVIVGAALDRNGLRPARYKVTDDGTVVMASEVGVLDMPDSRIKEKGRLGPGHMIAVDLASHKLYKNDELKTMLAQRRPYEQWVSQNLFSLPKYLAQVDGNPVASSEASVSLQRAFGYTSEELHLVLLPMVVEAREPVGSMGDDTPLAVLSAKPRLLYSYFKQKFAQVTNPAIDPLREHIVMSLNTYLGARRSILEETPEHVKLVSLSSPILLDNELEALIHLTDPAFQTAVIPCLFPVKDGPQGLRLALEEVCRKAEEAVDGGKSILVLSDKGVDGEHAPVPMLLAVGAVHNHLIRIGKRMRCSIIVQSGEPREMHHMACLIGYGASAINPYLALASVKGLSQQGHGQELSLEKALSNYRKTLDKQILKIMSKMGISAVTGYHGAQIFEAIGLGPEVIELCFSGTPSLVGGIGFQEIAREILERHRHGFAREMNYLDDWGYYRFRKDGEVHGFSPLSVRALHKAVADDGSYELYQKYLDLVSSASPIALRDLLAFMPLREPVPLEEVELAQQIVKRFATGSMSLGALSPEAHETLSIAMNRMGAKSNTGEGGEDPRRYRLRMNGDSSNSKAKQVASGRFGVTPEYLAMAEELEIKMAQGSKPGEGGQLPGHKVVEHIARIRHTQPGVTLISPPPHHDIYSIEDLAQLIYDLKMANPRARVAVKLVAEAGVGTIAAGVAKGYADIVHISGHEGGTGASPLSSIKNAGSAWELGLAETQQVLVTNDLRGRVVVRADGGFRSARDVLVAALLGAEEYTFGTSALVSIGCQMARQCHLNTCPVGVATQDPELRKKFWGTPEMAVRYFFYLAEELRRTMASLGIRRLDEVIGRADLLRQKEIPGHPKANKLDLTPILTPADPTFTRPSYHVQERNNRPGEAPLDDLLLPQVLPGIMGREAVKLELPISNADRTVGARIAGEIAYRVGDRGLPDGSIELRFRGSAGQSFGAFLTRGLRLTLVGEANDYVGKGMNGGEIVVRPPEDASYHPHDNVIMGNAVLYGATGGYLFAAGRAGERFAVRNSGACAVIEGVGDHCCEYMTGGVVVVLGPTGRNFGAGMSGGAAYVLDLDNSITAKLNPEMVQASPVASLQDIETLHSMLKQHQEATGSPRVRDVLEHWDTYLPMFKIVGPRLTVAPPAPREEQRQRRDALAATRKSIP